MLKDEGEREGRNAFQAGAMMGSVEEPGWGGCWEGLHVGNTSLVAQLVKNLPAVQESQV